MRVSLTSAGRQALVEFGSILGDHLEKVEKGIPVHAGPIREAYGELLDAVVEPESGSWTLSGS